MNKTSAIRLLEKLRISHTLHAYEVNDEDLTGVTVAKKIGVSAESVFKTLVAINDKKSTLIFCIPTDYELNLKKAANVSGSKKIELIKTKDLLSTTGYIRGGCSPIGMKKLFPTYIDETAQLFNDIFISGGTRGIQIKISPFDLVKLADASFEDLI
jgi:Cys-tRNA(Pro)/Cys-tRNA(Cys) deacylase